MGLDRRHVSDGPDKYLYLIWPSAMGRPIISYHRRMAMHHGFDASIPTALEPARARPYSTKNDDVHAVDDYVRVIKISGRSCDLLELEQLVIYDTANSSYET